MKYHCHENFDSLPNDHESNNPKRVANRTVASSQISMFLAFNLSNDITALHYDVLLVCVIFELFPQDRLQCSWRSIYACLLARYSFCDFNTSNAFKLIFHPLPTLHMHNSSVLLLTDIFFSFFLFFLSFFLSSVSDFTISHF